MLPPKKAPSGQRELTLLYGKLSEADRHALLSYARFLVQQEPPDEHAAKLHVPNTPLEIARPEKESVVAAIRRLASTYPMLNKDELLHQASNLMGGHIMHGHPAREVIDRLEALFAEAYERYAAELTQAAGE